MFLVCTAETVAWAHCAGAHSEATCTVPHSTRLTSKSESANESLDALLEVLPTALVGMDLSEIDSSKLLDQIFTHTNAHQLIRGFRSKQHLAVNATTLATLDAASLKAIQEVSASRMDVKGAYMDLGGQSLEGPAKKEKRLKKDSGGSSEDADEDKDTGSSDALVLAQKLERVVQRIPVYMYLMDDRDKSVFESFKDDCWQQVFSTTTTLSGIVFKNCVDGGVLAPDSLNRVGIQFRTFDSKGLYYLEDPAYYPFTRHGSLSMSISVDNTASYR